MQHQPIPDVTSNDVERIVRRDYSEAQFSSVIDVLKIYEQSPSGRHELARVQLATLKLANGDPDALQRHINTAVQDFRDVLAPAEYPEYSTKIAFRSREFPAAEKERIVERDWKQYLDWLKR